MTVLDPFARLKALQAPRRKLALAPEEPRGIAAAVPQGSVRLAEMLGASVKRNRAGEYFVLRKWFSESIGCEPQDGAFDPEALRLLSKDTPEDAADPRQWLFLDTETTGLAGGTGTYPFMVGIGWWDAGGFEVEQFFMRDLSEEHSVLLALAERIAERPVLVTFNGKSFDWPLLETRYRMTRTIQTPKFRAHFDFLHPARNLWRLRIGSVRLQELERHVLGWNRGVDVASELIPSLYFNFLRGGSPDPLVPIFYHNQMDLRGLAGIATRILSLLADPDSTGSHPLELFGVSRICERRGESARARKLYSRSIECGLPDDASRAARKAMARLAKREGDFPAARALWESMLGNSSDGLDAYEELAVHFEHRAREPRRAAEIVREALSEIRRAHRLGTMTPAVHRVRKEKFEKRLARIELKITRANSPPHQQLPYQL